MPHVKKPRANRKNLLSLPLCLALLNLSGCGVTPPDAGLRPWQEGLPHIKAPVLPELPEMPQARWQSFPDGRDIFASLETTQVGDPDRIDGVSVAQIRLVGLIGNAKGAQALVQLPSGRVTRIATGARVGQERWVLAHIDSKNRTVRLDEHKTQLSGRDAVIPHLWSLP